MDLKGSLAADCDVDRLRLIILNLELTKHH